MQPHDAGGEFECVICLETLRAATHEVCLPCCGAGAAARSRKSRRAAAGNGDAETASEPDAHVSFIRFCRACVTTLAAADREGCIRCPTCRACLRVVAEPLAESEATRPPPPPSPTPLPPPLRVEVLPRGGQCQLCHQVRELVDRQLPVCEPCCAGMRGAPIAYECSGCGGFQRIPHPMWRYQATPLDWSSDTWFCHQRCQAQQRWRIMLAHVNRVPAAEAPPGWAAGRPDEQAARIATMRQQVAAARRGDGDGTVAAAPAAATAPGDGSRVGARLLFCAVCAVAVALALQRFGWLD
jgi:hypothetical protein